MRLWSLAPSQLDRRGLVACWRETLLAQKVLEGHTVGYTRHPQLQRFRALDDPLAGISSYLQGLLAAAERRGYSFDGSKIHHAPEPDLRVEVTSGQLAHEWAHLRGKVEARDPEWFTRHLQHAEPRPHPMFTTIPGGIAPWEVL